MDVINSAVGHNDFEHIMCSALRHAGFTIVPRAIVGPSAARLDIVVTAFVKCAATSNVSATYTEYEADVPRDLMETLGNTIRLVTWDRIEPVDLVHPAAPMRWKFLGVVLESSEASKRNTQTT